MQFILIAHDKADGLKLRQATRAAHLAYCEQEIGTNLLYAGPILGADGGSIGSVLIVEAADSKAAEALFAKDPYALAGLFVQTSVNGFRTVFRDGVLVTA